MAALAAGPAPGENGAAPDTKAALIATWSQAGWMIAQTTQTSVCADGTVVVAITAPTAVIRPRQAQT